MNKRKIPWYKFKSSNKVELKQLYDLLFALSILTLLFPYLLNTTVIIDGWRLTVFSLMFGFLISLLATFLVLGLSFQEKAISTIRKSNMRYFIYCTTCLSPMIAIFVNEIPTSTRPVEVTITIQKIVTRTIKSHTVHCAKVEYEGHELEIGLPDEQWQKAKAGKQIRFEVCRGFLYSNYVGKRSVL